MSRFKLGQTVYMDRGDKMRTLVVAKVHKNPMIPIRQYSFEAPHDGFLCGEQSIRATKDGPDLKLKECFVDDDVKVVDSRVMTLASATRTLIEESHPDVNLPNLRAFDSFRVGFKPSLEMCEWLRDYANDRLIIHVDSGQGHLIKMLKMVKAKVVGIEPNIDHEQWIKIRMLRDGGMIDVNEVITRPFEDNIKFLEGIGQKGILVFTNPKANGNLKIALDKLMGKMEILLITKEYKFETKYWRKLQHKGQSENNEAVYSL